MSMIQCLQVVLQLIVCVTCDDTQDVQCMNECSLCNNYCIHSKEVLVEGNLTSHPSSTVCTQHDAMMYKHELFVSRVFV